MTDEEIVDFMVNKNQEQFNYLKFCEEATELQELLLKKVNKVDKKDIPSNLGIIDEIGDVKVRLLVLEKMFGEDNINERVKYKMEKWKGYIEKGKYQGKL